jgi:hypothetical protein
MDAPPLHGTSRALKAILVGALALAACGKRGDPLPPIRRTPQPVTDFKVSERGDQLEMSLLAPRAFTDGKRLPVLEIEILRAGAEGTFEKVARSSVTKAAPGERIVVDEPLPPVGTVVRLSARARVQGRPSTQAPIVSLTIAATPAAPSGLSARSSEKGVTLSWTPPEIEGPSFSVYRRPKPGDYGLPLLDKPTTDTTMVDEKALPGDSLCYEVRTVSSTAPLRESAATEEACLVVEDVAAPATPVGVAAQPREGGLEVSWSPSPEADLAGYRVYRWSQGVPVARIADVPAGETSYLDSDAPTGTVVRYSVTAVDKSGNESGRSPAAPASRP